jgi:hypothetical protein
MGCDDCISRAHINPLQLITTHYAPYYASSGVGLEKRVLLAQKKGGGDVFADSLLHKLG